MCRPLLRSILLLLTLSILPSCQLADLFTGRDAMPVGAAFVPTNEDQNRVVVFARYEDGMLRRIGDFETGGRGTAGRIVPRLDKVIVDPLFSSDSGILSPDRQLFFVVNAGDSSVTSFRVNDDYSLTLADREGTGGAFPVSIGVASGGLLYVGNVNSPNNLINPGGTRRATVTGFRYDAQGNLTPIPNSMRTLSTDTGHPSQLLFNEGGTQLVVFELFANTITVFPIGTDGTPGAPRVNPVPVGAFGADWAGPNTLVSADVSPPMMPGMGSASSWTLNADGSLTPVSVQVRNGKETPCWVAITPDGRFVYTSDTATGTVQLYRNTNGQLTLVDADAAFEKAIGAVAVDGKPTSGPVDTFISSDGRFFYQQYSGRGAVAAYRIGDDGSLTEIADYYGLLDFPLVGAEGIDGF